MFAFCCCGEGLAQFSEPQAQSPESQMLRFLLLAQVLHGLVSHKRGCGDKVCVEYQFLMLISHTCLHFVLACIEVPTEVPAEDTTFHSEEGLEINISLGFVSMAAASSPLGRGC